MKYSSQSRQLGLDIFSSTLEKSLDPSNRWYRLANSMPWDKIEQAYNKRLDNRHCGGGNKSARMVVGALIIKHKMNLSDVETIRIISENPYMQYFVGLEMFTSKPVFDPSLFVYIRKRLDVDSFNGMSVALMEEAEEDDPGDGDEHNGNGSNTMGDGGIVVDAQGNPHKGSITGIISGNTTSLFDLLTKKERQWIGERPYCRPVVELLYR